MGVWAWGTPPTHVRAHVGKHGGGREYVLDEEKLAEQYRGGARVRELASEHGVSKEAIRRRLKRAGIVLRPAARERKHPKRVPKEQRIPAPLPEAEAERLRRLVGLSATKP